MSGNGRREGFNADERAKRRTDGVVTIGGVAYHPVKLTNKILREVRRVSRMATKAAEGAAIETDEYKTAYEAAIADGKSEDEAKAAGQYEATFAEAVDVLNGHAIADQLQMLLVDDNMKQPTKAQMRKTVDEVLDNRDQIALLQYLTGEDPLAGEAATPANSASST